MAELPEAFARFWHDPRTADQERKRVVRLLIEDVTVEKAEQIAAHVRIQGWYEPHPDDCLATAIRIVTLDPCRNAQRDRLVAG